MLVLLGHSAGEPVSSRDQDFFKAMGARIAAARKAHDLTQQDLAEHLGVAQQTYAQYEVGIRRIPASMLPDLSQRLGLTMDELMGIRAHTRSKPGPMTRFERQFERIRLLPRTKQQVLMEMLEGFLIQTGH
jgi:transcriptional regulator with XRE-family HTH domain